jgi:hypothetical protein
LGTATYGRSWTLANPAAASGPGAAATGAGAAGPFTREQGFLAYYEIAQLGGTTTYDPITHTVYTVSGNQYVSWDNPATLNEKVDFIIAKGLGGTMIWALDLDDFSNGYPLVTAISQRLYTPATAAFTVTLPRASLATFNSADFTAQFAAQFQASPQQFRVLQATSANGGGVTVDIQVVEAFTTDNGSPAPAAATVSQQVQCGNQAGTYQYSSTCVNNAPAPAAQPAADNLPLIIGIAVGSAAGVLLLIGAVLLYRWHKNNSGVTHTKHISTDTA